VTRLERAALVARRGDPADRRSFRVRLTASGRRRPDAARITHNDVIRTGFTGKLSRTQLTQLSQAWHALAESNTPLHRE
jgi:DNA-binding MarR family transcriptional regulator